MSPKEAQDTSYSWPNCCPSWHFVLLKCMSVQLFYNWLVGHYHPICRPQQTSTHPVSHQHNGGDMYIFNPFMSFQSSSEWHLSVFGCISKGTCHIPWSLILICLAYSESSPPHCRHMASVRQSGAQPSSSSFLVVRYQFITPPDNGGLWMRPQTPTFGLPLFLM